MHTNIKVKNLSIQQWDHIQSHVQAQYDMPPIVTRVSVVFELGPQAERCVDMPLRQFTNLLIQLHLIGALTPDALPEHLEQVRDAADPARARGRADLESEWERVDPEGVAALRKSATKMDPDQP